MALASTSLTYNGEITHGDSWNVILQKLLHGELYRGTNPFRLRAVTFANGMFAYEGNVPPLTIQEWLQWKEEWARLHPEYQIQ